MRLNSSLIKSGLAIAGMFGFLQAEAQFGIIKPRTPSLSGGFQIAVPQQDFRNQFTSHPIGFEGTLTLPLGKHLPFEIGGSFAYNSIGSQTRDIDLTQTDGSYTAGHMAANINGYTFHGLGRFRPLNGKIRPYVDVLGGLRTYTLHTKITKSGPNGDTQTVADESTQRNTVWSSGWAAGIQWRLLPGLFAEGRFEKLQGGSAQYVDPNTLQIDQTGNVGYGMTQSSTQQYTITLGLALSF